MKKTIILIFCLWAMGVAYAQNPLGKWNAQGTNPDGSAYKGVVDISLYKNDIYKLKWQTGGVSYTGVGYLKNGNLFSAWGQDITYGLALYTIGANGTMECAWLHHAQSMKDVGTGTETLTGGKAGQIAGTYQVKGKNPAGQSYQGTVKIQSKGDNIYLLTWTLNDGAPYNGIGFVRDKQLIVGWGIGEAYGVVMYEFVGKNANGSWTGAGMNAMGTEKLTK